MKLYYENSKGEIIDFMNWPVVAQNPEVLAERSWGYATETNQDGTKRFKQFYKELEQKNCSFQLWQMTKHLITT